MDLGAVLAEWGAMAFSFASRHALLLAFLGAMAENTILLGLLTPGGPVVALAAAGARTAGVPLPLMIVVAGAGMTAGALFDYYLGRLGAHQLLRHPRAGRIGQRLAAQLDQVQPLLYRHGWWVILVAQAWSYARTTVALGAGAARFPLHRFALLEAPVALLWATLWSLVGYSLAAGYERFEPLLQKAGWVALSLIALVLLGRRFLLPRLLPRLQRARDVRREARRGSDWA
jgi:membrane-associated protein